MKKSEDHQASAPTSYQSVFRAKNPAAKISQNRQILESLDYQNNQKQ